MCGARGGGRIGCSEIDGDMEKEGGSANSGSNLVGFWLADES